MAQPNARLEVNDGLGQRIVPINKELLCIGRRDFMDALTSSEAAFSVGRRVADRHLASYR